MLVFAYFFLSCAAGNFVLFYASYFVYLYFSLLCNLCCFRSSLFTVGFMSHQNYSKVTGEFL